MFCICFYGALEFIRHIFFNPILEPIYLASLAINEAAITSGTAATEIITKPFIDSVANFTFLGYPNTYTPAASEVFNSRLLSNCFTNIVTGSDPAEEIAKLQTDMQAVYDKEK